MKKIIATVGTSIFTNYIKASENKSEMESISGSDGLFNKLENKSYDTEEMNSKSTKALYKVICNYWLETAECVQASAEIESLITIQKATGTNLQVHLIASDTILSRIACDLINYFFNKVATRYGIVIIDEEFVVKGLQVDNADEFRRTGLLRLFRRLDELIVDENHAPYTAINITGGYKAFIPFITILGQINKIPIYYLYENTGKLINIPPLPLSIDYGFIEQHYTAFNELNDTRSGNWIEYKRKMDLPDTFDSFIELIEDSEDSFFELSAIGKYLFENYNTSLIVKIHKDCKLDNDKEGNKKQLFNAIQELYERLNREISQNSIKDQQALEKHIDGLGDTHDLRHGRKLKRDNSIYLFKSTNKEHIRIFYHPELDKSNKLVIFVIYYLRGASSFNHSTYIDEFSKKLDMIDLSDDYTTINLLKI